MLKDFIELNKKIQYKPI